LFIVEPSSYICYDGRFCEFEFIIPIDSSNHYFYWISKQPAYKLRVFIDGVESYSFEQTALPYNLTVKVTNLYTDEPISNVTVAIMEYNGNNIFIPLRLSGVVSRAMSITATNENGIAEFVAVPTEYPEIEDYNFSVSILDKNYNILKQVNVSVLNAGSIVAEKKHINRTDLSNDAKTTVNSLASIISSLYYWANMEKKAKSFFITVYTNGSYFNSSPLVFQTGAPNLISVVLKTPSGSTVDGFVMPVEESGLLLMHPVNETSPLGKMKYRHEDVYVPTGVEFVVTPTSYPPAKSKVKLKVFDSSMNEISSIDVKIDSSLTPSGGNAYENNELKVTINSMASVVGSLYYSLN